MLLSHTLFIFPRYYTR